jgi:phage tail-like protein
MTLALGGQITINSPDEPERIHEIQSAVVRIGRSPAPENEIVLAHNWVSRNHARIYCDRLPYRIQDLGSSNGTSVNDAPLPPDEIRTLQDGDVIAIGPFRLRLEAPPPSEGPVDAQGQAESQEEVDGLAVRAAPRRPPPRPPAPPVTEMGSEPVGKWVGMPDRASRWLQYLPPLYTDDEFLGRFLLIFEDMLGTIQSNITHFDLYLDPATSPAPFLPWLNAWMGDLVEERWTEKTRRALLKEASWLYQARGTRAGLARFLQICTGCEPEIIENADGAHMFRIILRPKDRVLDRATVERIIELNRPAHTRYVLEIEPPTA